MNATSKKGITVPDTLRRSSARAQRAYAKALKIAQEQYVTGGSSTGISLIATTGQGSDDHAD